MISFLEIRIIVDLDAGAINLITMPFSWISESLTLMMALFFFKKWQYQNNVLTIWKTMKLLSEVHSIDFQIQLNP